ncbi:MAG: hypothetical protein H6718_17025 [Polyangiaceae bacterium]|nr:hypothetical protein [Polyangiaceae bacterium]MCB9609521.1 hypothetical protein [Polyangiaceae bacterium]
MCAKLRHGLALLLGLLLFAWAPGALAWIETSVRSDLVTVEVARDGTAVVTHELIMRVRGGPLKSFELAGVDGDAEVLPNASVTNTRAGAGVSDSTPLLIEKSEDGSLKIEIDNEKGLRRGRYLFRFAYKTNLVGRDLITAKGAGVELRWVGPRLESGVDSAKVVFRLPRAAKPPHVPDVQSPSAGIGMSEEFDGVFLSNLSREGEIDVLEVVRPHVAKGEPVVWRVQADAGAFDAFSQEAGAEEPVLVEAQGPHGLPRAALWAGAALAALLYALLVALKARAVSLACTAREARARVLLPLPAPLRGALAGIILGAAVVVGVLLDQPTGFGVLLVLSMLCASHLTPRLSQVIRGPGSWRGLEPRWLRADSSEASLPGRFLDTGRLPGFFTFVLLLGAFGAVAVLVFKRSPYFGMMVAMGSASLLPIFCTGRAGELPPDPVARPRRLLRYLIKKLAKRRGVDARLVGRFPEGSEVPDELRLEVLPRRGLRGLRAIEVGLEYHQTGTGPVGMPCVIVRVQDESAAYSALPRSVVWTRGRDEDERVTILRPKLPTYSMTLALVERLLVVLAARKRRPAPGAPKSVRVNQAPVPHAA